MAINPNEILRRLDNLFRLGTIADIDYQTAKVRVQTGNILTDWLPWLTFRTGTTTTWSPPTINEQCIVFAISGELTTAVVLVGLYTQNMPSHDADEHLIQFTDGATVSYNQATHHLSAKGLNTATIQASQTITADTPQIVCTGNVEIQGDLVVTGAITTSSSISATGEVQGNGIALSTHKHNGVESGNKKTGSPTQ